MVTRAQARASGRFTRERYENEDGGESLLINVIGRAKWAVVGGNRC